MKYTLRNPSEVEAITFDELVQHGRDNGANIVNGMPWSFQWQNMPVSHENDNCYIINNTVLARHEVLVADKNTLFTMYEDDFHRLFYAVESSE